MNNSQMDRGNEKFSPDDREKPRKTPSQIGRHRDLNSESPEYESSVLPCTTSLSYFCIVMT